MEVIWQVCCLFVFFLTGIIGALIFDIFLSFMALIRFKGIVKLVCEIIFAFTIFLLMSTVLVFMTQGEVRLIFLLVIGSGALCYFLFFSKQVRPSMYQGCRRLLRTVNKGVYGIGRIFSVMGLFVTAPIRLFYKLMVYIISIIQYIFSRTRSIFKH